MSAYQWNLLPEQPAGQRFGHVHPLVARILQQRGLTTAEAMEDFLYPKYPENLHDPFSYTQMQVAVDRIIAAIKKSERITVFGDYDADGICATTIMVEILTALGGNVNWYIPERLAEGYGLNSEAVTNLISQGTELLITVDCGTSNIQEIELAKTSEVDVVVLDHHQAPSELPPAHAIINPFLPGQTYPFDGHASGGVAFTVARALLSATNNGKALQKSLKPGWEKWLLDVVAISTVADMMVLQGENRLLVLYGLKTLRKTRRPGLRALFALIGSDADQSSEYTIGYQIAPRLNAAGRLQHASTALRLLLTTDPDEAEQLAKELQDVNSERQKLTELAVAEAMEQVREQGQQPAYVAFAPHWSPGIVGLIAGRIVERVWRPVVVMTENGDAIVGSGRSVPGFNITAHLRTGEQHFLRFGGHAGACGFTLATKDGRTAFAEWFQTTVGTAHKPTDRQRPLTIDTEAQLAEFNPDALDQLEALGPFGTGNERPKFLVRNVELQSIRPVGQTQQHLRARGRQGSTEASFIAFRMGDRQDELEASSAVDVVIEASWNSWQGRKEPQLKVIDFRPSV